MKCAKCGFATEDSAKFCPGCGAQMIGVANIGGAALEGVETASPGRRWSARLFDLWLGYVVVGFVQGCVAPSLEINAAVLLLLYIPLALCLEGLEYWAFGGTFGKWVFSVKVLDSAGGKLRSSEYWKRLLPVWVSGLGLGIPIVILVTEIWQYRRLKKGLAASYDEKAGYAVVQFKQGFVKGLVCILFILAMIALMQLGNSME